MNNPYIFLAKSAVEIFIKEGRIIDLPEDLPKEFLTKKAGTFVTIEEMVRQAHHKYGELQDLPRNQAKLVLRGCIGTYLPTKENIAEEIVYNAIAAATEDYRFGPIKKEELPQLSYTVYILSEPELVKDVSKHNPKKFGVIVKTIPLTFPNRVNVVFDGHVPDKTGLLLPDLEGIETAEQQIAIACQKGEIDLAREKILIYRFAAEHYKEI